MASNLDTMDSPDKENESHEGITVAFRMRPLNRAEGNGKRGVWKTLKKYNSVAQTTLEGKPLSERISGRNFFTFDRVFGEEDNTVQIYDGVVKGIVSSFVNGLNGTIFAYGQTSSGKTYTMQGSGSIEEGASSHGGGVVHMAAKDIFSHIKSQPNRMFLVRASFLEIYNEEVRDLLSNTGQNLQIREDPRRGVFVQSHEEMVTDFESLLRILFQGEKFRAIASTGMNERSSRSHTIFRITVESREKENEDDDAGDDYSESGGDGAVRVSTLNLVDLAGSESVRHTGATGERQKEGGMINQSLLTLSRVIVALGQPNQMHVNFRDSKLTRILQPSLSGNARMAVICCATPSELYLEETRSTLQFASRAKLVKTNAQVNEVLDDRSIIRKLQRELAEARGGKTGPGSDRLLALENKAASAGTAALEAKEKLNRLKASILNASYLFGGNGTVVGSEAAVGNETMPNYNLRSRKRRQSDGGGPHSSGSSPIKSIGKVLSSPKTAPRKKKGKKFHPALTPNAELSILRQALSSRNELSRSLKESLQNTSKILGEKEAEIENLITAKDGLAEEKVHAHTELSNVQSTLALVQANLDATISEYDTLLAEKEKSIVDAFENVEAESTKVLGLEDTNAKLLEQLGDLQKRFDCLQEERVRSAFELAHSTEEKEKLMSEHEQDKVTLNEMNQKIGILMTAANHGETERKASEESIRELEQQLVTTLDERNAAFKKVETLEDGLASLRDEMEKERRATLETTAEYEFRLESVLEEKMSALSHNAELEDAVQNAEAELAAAQEKSSDAISTLASECEFLQAKVSGMELEALDLRNASDETIRDLTVQVSSLSEELATAHTNFVALRTQVTAKEIEKSELVTQVGLLSTELEAFRLDCIELKSNFDVLCQTEHSLRAELESSHEHLVRSEAEYETLQAKMSELTDEAVKERKASEESIFELEQQLMATSDKMSAAFQQVETLEVALAGLQNEMEEVKHETLATTSKLEIRLQSVLEEKMAALSRNAELEDAVQIAEAELAAAQEKSSETISTLASECEILQAKVSGLEHEAHDLRETSDKTIRDLHVQVSSLSEELATAHTNFVALRTQVTAKEIEKSELLTQVGLLSTELEAFRLDCIELKSNVDVLCQTEHSLRAELESSHEHLLRSEAEYENLQAKMSELTDEAVKERKASEESIFQLEQQLMATSAEKSAAIQHGQTLEVGLEGLQNEMELFKHEALATTSELEIRLQSVLKEKMAALSRISELEVGVQLAEAEVADVQEKSTEAISTLAKEYKILQDKVSGLEHEAHDLRNTSEETIRDLRVQVSSLSEELATAHTNFVALRTQVTAKEIEKSELLTQIGILSNELEGLRSGHTEQASNVDALRQTERSLRAELDSSNERFVQRETDFNAMLNEKERIFSDSMAEKLELRQANDGLLAELHDARVSQSLLQSRYSEIEKANAVLRSNNDDIHDKFATALGDKKELESFLSAAEEEINAVQEQKLALENDLTKIQNSLEESQRLLQNSATQVKDLQEAYADIENELKRSQQKIESLELEKQDLQQNLDSFDDERVKMESWLIALETERNAALAEHELQITQLEGLTALLTEREKSLKELEDVRDSQSSDQFALKKELGKVQALYDDSVLKLQQCQADLELATSARENTLATLRDRENERDEAVCALNNELSRNLANSLPNEKDARLEKELAEMKQSNVELTKLLESSNGSEGRLRVKVANLESELLGRNRELEDSYYQLSQLEEELRQSELAFEEKFLLNPTENPSDRHVELLHEIESLQKAIDNEKLERRAVEDNLKRQMGEEQRLLLQEGENMMESLRCKVLEVEERLRESEEEAYTCREQLAEIQDQKAVAERNCASLAAAVDDLKAAATREADLASSLKNAFSKAKAEIYSLKENAVDLKEKVRKAEAQAKKLEQEQDATTREITMLKNQLVENNYGSESLRAEVTQLKVKISEKDQRIKKLQTFKLTKEFAEEYRQLKKDNRSLNEELSRLRSEVSELQSQVQLQSTDSDTVLRTEVSALRFDNEALEKKLRKFAAHCQRLENDKVGMTSALRSCNVIPSDFDGDINEAVISLCDRLTSLRETESVRSGRSKGGSERLESENLSLQSKLQRLNDKIARYQSEIEDLRKKLKSGEESSSDADGEASRKLRYLEQENLQLMFDVKTTKKQLQAAREEIEVLRINAMDNSTLDFGTVDFGSDSSQLSKVAKPNSAHSKPKEFPKKASTTSLLSDKTNVSSKDISLDRNDRKRPAGRLPTVRTTSLQSNAPGLGEAAVQGDETGECNQS